MEKPTHKNKHLQTAQCKPAIQSLQESNFFPNPRQIKKKYFPSQKNKTYHVDRQRNINIKKEALGGNTVLPKAGLNCFDGTFVQGSTLGLLLNFGAKNPRLQQYPNRQAVKKIIFL